MFMSSTVTTVELTVVVVPLTTRSPATVNLPENVPLTADMSLVTVRSRAMVTSFENVEPETVSVPTE